MSANPLPPWRRGDPLAADRFNAMQAAMVTDVIAGPGLRGIRGGGSVSLSLVPQAGGGAMSLVLVQNTTGAALPPFSVLGLGDPSCTPTQSAQGFREQLVLKGVTPTAADHGDKFVICEESFGVNAVLPCVLTGAARVQVNVTNASHTWAAVKDGDSTQLESAASGPARILWKESGTGVKWAVVQLGMPQPDSDEEPDTIGSTDETEAAATDEWDAEDTDASPNVDIVMQTRTAYNHAGDKKLYAYYRTFSYVCGRLVKISAETRVEIDAPEDC